MFDRLEPEFGSVVVQRRPGAATVSTAWWLRYRQASPSAHLDVSGRAPAVKPQGLDCRRHAAAGAKPCVRMGAPNPPATGRALSALTKPDDMQSPHTFEQRQRMPYCESCRHKGEDHNWRVPPCFECGSRRGDCANCRRQRESRRLRGACLIFECICSKYVPLQYQRRPANPLIGRLRFRKRR